MAVTWNPLAPWHWAVTILAGGAVLLLLIRLLFSDRERKVFYFGDRLLWQAAILGCTVASASFFIIAAWNPVILKIKPGPHPHLAVVLDGSLSALSGAGDLQAMKGRLVDWLEPSIAALEPELRENATASIITIGVSGSLARNTIPLIDLADAVKQLSERELPDGAGTNIEEGLRLAKKQIDDAEGQGAVLLVSDGNQTGGDAFAAAQTLTRSGIPVYVLPLVGGSSAVYLAAADLPPQISARKETNLRWLVQNRLKQAAQVEFTITVNPGSQEDGHYTERIIRQSTVSLPAEKWANFQVPLTFEGVGLQFVDLTMKVDDGIEETQIQRRFFIYVLEPPRVLAIGGDNRWTSFYSPDELLIDYANAAELSAETVFYDYDSVVINNVDARTLSNGLLDRLAEAVTKDGIGLFFVNGQQSPRSEDEPAILNSYEGTPIEPLLPVSVRPRDETQEPPPRNVVFLMDVSGSMEGAKLETSKQIAQHLIRTYLRPQDRLDVITFTTDAQHVVQSLAMGADGKQQAASAIAAIPVGGGTDPTQALNLLTQLKVSNCGLIFLSDGEFAPVASRPDCRAAVFDIGQNTVDPNFPLDIADPLPVPVGFNPASVTIPYFEPEIRKKFFEAGTFQPLSTKASNPLAAALPFPENLQFDGSAISYIKEGADLIAVRPKLTDPVLAFLDTGEGTVGLLTSELSPQWLEHPDGRSALSAWVQYTVAYSARNRYVFQLSDLGGGLELCISVVSEGPVPAQITGMQVELRLEGQVMPVRMVEEEAPGHYCGRTTLPALDTTAKATLTIKENGVDAIPKKQRIPILLPASRSAAAALPGEAYSYGTNIILLKRIALEGGGLYNPERGTALFLPRTEQTRANPLWPWLLATGTAFYLAAILIRRINN
jgi:Mg-chelatase subunit ChlD